jgi:hypothetical protein
MISSRVRDDRLENENLARGCIRSGHNQLRSYERVQEKIGRKVLSRSSVDSFAVGQRQVFLTYW